MGAAVPVSVPVPPREETRPAPGADAGPRAVGGRGAAVGRNLAP